MKTNNYNLLITFLILLSFVLLSSFVPTKYAKDFKKRKKEITSFVILKPYVEIISDNGHDSLIDTQLVREIGLIIDSIANNLLNNKYIIETLKTPSLNNNLLYDLLNEIEDMPKTLPQVSYKSIFSENVLSKKNRYALFISYRSIYNPDFPPHFKLYNAMNATVVITPKVKTRTESDICILLLDTQEEEIVFYDRSITSAYDPRVKSEIEQMTKSMLKQIYYK